jgi:hypothetical protein
MQLEQHPQKNDVINNYKVVGVIKEKRHGLLFVWFKVKNEKNGERRLWGYNPENMKLGNFRTFDGLGGVQHYRTW